MKRLTALILCLVMVFGMADGLVMAYGEDPAPNEAPADVMTEAEPPAAEPEVPVISDDLEPTAGDPNPMTVDEPPVMAGDPATHDPATVTDDPELAADNAALETDEPVGDEPTVKPKADDMEVEVTADLETTDLFALDGATLVRYIRSDRSVVIPDGVEIIGVNAFKGNRTLEHVTIPASVREIRARAFENCENLSSVIVAGGSALETIGEAAFAGCSRLTDHAFADGVEHVDATAFDAPVTEAETQEDESETPAADLEMPATEPETPVDDPDIFDEAEIKIVGRAVSEVKYATSSTVGFKDEVITISASVTGISGEPSFQWQYSSDGNRWYKTGLPGNNTDTLTINVTEARLRYQYRCVVSIATQTVYGTGVQLTYKPNPEVMVTPSALIGFKDSTIMVTSEIENDPGEMSYQWQYSSNGEKWYKTGLTGNDTDTLTIAVTRARLNYYYRLTATYQGRTWPSNAVKMTFAEEPKITVTPSAMSAYVGETITVSSAVENDPGEMSYQWQYSSDGEKWYKTGLTGNDTDTLTIAVTRARLNYYYRLTATYGGGRCFSNAVKMTLVEEPKITVTPSAMSAYVGETITVSSAVENDPGEMSYQWQYSNDGEKWYKTGLTGNDTDTLTIAVTRARLSYYYRLSATYQGRTYFSNAVKMTFAEEPKITVTPSATIGFSGETITVTSSLENVPGEPSYQWYYSSDGEKWYKTGITGNNTHILIIEVTQARLNYYYRLTVMSQGKNWDSNKVKITYKTTPTVTVTPSAASGYDGQTITIIGSVKNSPGTLSYQWERSLNGTTWSTTTLTGATSTRLSVPVTQSNLSYRYRLTVSYQGRSWSSDAVRVAYIPPDPNISISPSATVGYEGDEIKVTGSIGNNPGGLTYQWQYSSDNSKWYKCGLTGNDTLVLTINVTQARLNYYYRLTASAVGKTWYSDSVKLTFKVKPVITAVPGASSYSVGDTVRLSATVKNTSGTLAYQWQYSTNGTNWYSQSSGTGVTCTFNATTTTLARTYRCRVTYDGRQWYSNEVTLGISTLKVSIEPTSVTVISGQQVQLKAVVSGGTGSYSYHWYRVVPGSSSETHVATTQTYTFNASTTYYYYCLVTSGDESAISDRVLVTVNEGLSVNVEPTSQTIVSGNSVTLRATITGGTSSRSIQWYKSSSSTGGSAISGATGASYTASPTSTTYYYCVVTSGGQSKTSNRVCITVEAELSVSISPTSQTIASGNSVTLRATITGGTSSRSIQWYKSSSSTGGSAISGATGTSYTASPTSTTYYYCVVTSGSQSRTSNRACIMVNAAPTPLTVSPTGYSEQYCYVGDTAYFSVTVSGGTGSYSFKWYKDNGTGSVTQVSTDQYYSFKTTSVNDSGTYYCEVTSGTQTATSGSEWLCVMTHLAIKKNPSSATVTAGTNVTLSVEAEGERGYYLYEWRRATTASGTGSVVSTDQNYTFTASTSNAGYYYCIVSAGDTSVTSQRAQITVKNVSSTFVITKSNATLFDISSGNTSFNVTLGAATGRNDTFTMNVSSDMTWTVSDSCSWFNITKSGNNAVMTFTDSISYNSLQGTATFTVNGQSITMRVTKPEWASGLELKVYHKNESGTVDANIYYRHDATVEYNNGITMGATAGSGQYYTIYVESNFSWNLTCTGGWFTASPTTAGTNTTKQLRLTLNGNVTSGRHTGTLVFTCGDNNQQITINVVKPADTTADFDLSVRINGVTYTAERNENTGIYVQVNSASALWAEVSFSSGLSYLEVAVFDGGGYEIPIIRNQDYTAGQTAGKTGNWIISGNVDSEATNPFSPGIHFPASTSAGTYWLTAIAEKGTVHKEVKIQIAVFGRNSIVDAVNALPYHAGMYYTTDGEKENSNHSNRKYYPEKTYHCWSYALYVQNMIYGSYSTTAMSNSCVAKGAMTKEKVKELVMAAGVGAHVRLNNSKGEFDNTAGHSFIITSITDLGFSIAQCHGYTGAYISNKTYTWEGALTGTGTDGTTDSTESWSYGTSWIRKAP